MKFDHLLPTTILDGIALQGFSPTGVLIPMNSYENRVYEVALDEQAPIVAKFYRPGRWGIQAITDEHQFIQALADNELPVISPLPLAQTPTAIPTIGKIDAYYYALYPKFRGKEHDEIVNDDRRWLGRMIARLHNVGATFRAPHRMRLTPTTYGEDSLQFILQQEFLPADLKQSIDLCLRQALQLLTPYFRDDIETIALHGDCHPGNVLWNRDGPHFLDFDDMVIAPPIQDIWMLFNGDAEEIRGQKEAFFEGYETFRAFDYSTLILAEPLRTLRMIRHAAWIGQRYGDPAFKRAFPYYEQRRYWEDYLQSIKEQIAVLQNLPYEGDR